MVLRCAFEGFAHVLRWESRQRGGEGRVFDGSEVAENKGDGVRMMLSIEALSVKASVNLRKRIPPIRLGTSQGKGLRNIATTCKGDLCLQQNPTYASRRVTGDPYPGVRDEKRLRTDASDSLRLSIGVNNVRTKTCCREMKLQV